MIISQSQISFSSSHQRSERTTQSESLEHYRSDAAGVVRRVSNDTSPLNGAAQVAAAQEAEVARVKSAPEARTLTAKEPAVPGSGQQLTDPRLRLQALLIAMLSGREVVLFDMNDLNVNKEGQPSADYPAEISDDVAVPGATGMRYEWNKQTEIREDSRVVAAGRLTTSDGASFDIGINVKMSYHNIEHERLVLTAGVQLKDPLVVNFDASAAELSSQRVDFDIDADGADDSINLLAPGSGFLMLDRNGDGVVNDGSELFGALSGNGFADLSTYDEDGNGFIDAGDTVFGELQIWIRNAQGGDEYASLAEKGIGALYLGSVETPFSLYQSGTELRGEVRATGLFIREDGSTGSLQQIDLVV